MCISSIVFSLLPLWIRTFQRESYEEHDVEVRTNLALLESLVVAGFTLSTGLTLTMRVINGQWPRQISYSYGDVSLVKCAELSLQISPLS